MEAVGRKERRGRKKEGDGKKEGKGGGRREESREEGERQKERERDGKCMGDVLAGVGSQFPRPYLLGDASPDMVGAD